MAALEKGTQAADVRIEQWERRSLPVLALAALVPLVNLGEETSIGIVIDFTSWCVFLVDLIIHVRLAPGYLGRRVGIFDASIVLLTFPWYFVTGVEGAVGLQVARLARLARVMVLMKGFKSFIRRVGVAALYAAVLVGVSAIMVWRVEPPDRGFTTLADGLWWGIVTLTTVGYGDLTPVTAAGRFAGILLMLSGIALLGILAGALASVFGLGRDEEAPDPTLEELARLRAQVEELNIRLAARSGEAT